VKIITPKLKFNISQANCYLPGEPISNLDILKRFPRTANKPVKMLTKFAEKLGEEFGFYRRYWCAKPWESLDEARDTNSESIGLIATKPLFESLPAKSLDAFVFGSTTNKRYTGSQACAILGACGVEAPTWDIKAGCSTSLASLHLAYGLLGLGYEQIIVSCAETLSKVIDKANEKTWLGLADGSAAIHLTKEEKGRFCVESVLYSTAGQYVDAYTTQGHLPPTHDELNSYGYVLQGDETLLKGLAYEKYTQMLEKLFQDEASRKAIRWIIPHQVSRKLIDRIMLEQKFHHADLIWHADKIGNVGGASIVYSLAKAFNEGVFDQDGKILMMSVGGGLSFAAHIIDYKHH
jgi:3-oxoacyl-[acyl-carrier-protein] synthase III